MKQLVFILLLLNFALLLADGVQPEGFGTEENPFQISIAENLLWMSTNEYSWNLHFVQTCDIDLSVSQEWNDGLGITPSGYRGTGFTGSYDGCGYEISNMYMHSNWNHQIGLFGYVLGGSISNLTLSDVDISGTYYVGPIVGIMIQGTQIVNCHTSGIINSESITGGLAGGVSNASITDCTSDVEIHVDYGGAAGLISMVYRSTVSNCSSSSSVSDGSGAAGLVNVAGLGSRIEYCTSTVDVEADGTVGGLIGEMFDTELYNSFYNIDAVSINGQHYMTIGGLPDDLYTAWIDSGMNLDIDDYMTFSGGSYLIQSVGDLEKLWLFGQTSEHPFSLECDLDFTGHANFYVPYLGVDFQGNSRTIDNLSINIPDRSSVGLFGSVQNARVDDLHVLNASVDGSSYCGILAGSIGNSPGIVNCTVNGTVNGSYYAGLLTGRCDESVISNCTVSGVVHTISYAGGISGLSIFNSSIIDCHATCEIYGNNEIGGLVGSNSEYSRITGCSSSGLVQFLLNGECFGGLVGHNYSNAVIENSWSVSEVNGEWYVGGLVGMNELHSTVSQCYSLGELFASFSVGGLIGRCLDTTYVENCYSKSEALTSGDRAGGLIGMCSETTVTNCYSTGYVYAEDEEAGLIADCEASTVEGCFWDIETSNQEESAAGTGLTTDEMLNCTNYLDAGWDFIAETENGTEDIWCIDPQINDGYPVLSWQEFEPIDDDPTMPAVTAVTQLHGNYPNPFNPETTISFSVRPNDTATLAIYNLKGQKVKSCGEFQTGEHRILWNGTNDASKPVASGVYLCRLKSKTETMIRKLMLLQ